MPASTLELFRSTMAHEPADGFLFYGSFTPLLEERLRRELHVEAGTALDAHFHARWGLPVDLRAPPDAPRPDYRRYYEGVDMPQGSTIDGNGTLHVPGSVAHFTHYVSALRNATSFREIEEYPFPSVADHTDGHMAEAVRAAHADGRFAVSWGGHMYEDAWQIRGYEPFLMDMIERPEWCEHILDRLMANDLRRAETAARAGVDMLRTGDDVANQNSLMFSRDLWRRFMKPRWARVFAAARRIKPDIAIWYHSDGNITDVIPELVEIGVDILNPLQPECLDPAEVKRRFGSRLVLDGTVGTQTTMPFGSPDEVRRVVRERVQTLGADGGLVLSPTHVLEPEVPVANVTAFFEEAEAARPPRRLR
jgi:uroporphyrinogen decarboxylase